MGSFIAAWLTLSLLVCVFNYACSKVSNPHRK